MGQLPSFTLSDLVSRSGFDKRTIAYYIAEGLLPKVGRRGRNTTYPQEFMERLMFIRRVRDLQDDGQLRAVTLSEIRDVMLGLSASEIRRAIRKGSSNEWVRKRFTDPDWDTSALAVPASMPREPAQDRWSDVSSEVSVKDSGVPCKSGMVSASRRRRALKEQMLFRRNQAPFPSRIEERQMQPPKSPECPEPEMDQLKEVIHRFGQRTDRMHDEVQEMRKELQYELREMKDLVLGLHERLKKVEDRIKPDPESDEDDSDSGED